MLHGIWHWITTHAPNVHLPGALTVATFTALAIALALYLVTASRWRRRRAAERQLAQQQTAGQAATGDSPIKRVTVRWYDHALTLGAAGMAEAVNATSMWHILIQIWPTWQAALMFTFADWLLVASAVRARRNLRLYGSVGVDGAALWVIAAAMALISATDNTSFAGLVLAGAPLGAAWMWERGLTPERRAQKQKRGETATGETNLVRRALHQLLQRTLVALRLAQPEERAIGDVDRHRRLTRLTRARYRLALLEESLQTILEHRDADTTGTAKGHRILSWKIRRAKRHLFRLYESTAERINLTGPDAATEVQVALAGMYHFVDATSRKSMSPVNPWSVDGLTEQAVDLARARLLPEFEARERDLAARLTERTAAELAEMRRTVDTIAAERDEAVRLCEQARADLRQISEDRRQARDLAASLAAELDLLRGAMAGRGQAGGAQPEVASEGDAVSDEPKPKPTEQSVYGTVWRAVAALEREYGKPYTELDFSVQRNVAETALEPLGVPLTTGRRWVDNILKKTDRPAYAMTEVAQVAA